MQNAQIDLPAIRRTLNMTQADLAKEAGVNLSTVWRWENEGLPTRGPAKAFIDRLALDAAKTKGLDLSADDFLPVIPVPKRSRARASA